MSAPRPISPRCACAAVIIVLLHVPHVTNFVPIELTPGPGDVPSHRGKIARDRRVVLLLLVQLLHLLKLHPVVLSWFPPPKRAA